MGILLSSCCGPLEKRWHPGSFTFYFVFLPYPRGVLSAVFLGLLRPFLIHQDQCKHLLGMKIPHASQWQSVNLPYYLVPLQSLVAIET